MALFSRKTVIIWPSDTAVYVLKKQTTWYGAISFCQGCTYTHMQDQLWLERPQKIEQVIADVMSTYGLWDYGVCLVIGGRRLLWKKEAMPTRNIQEARSLAAWDERINDSEAAYTFDLGLAGTSHTDGMYDWILGAYPEASLMAFIKGIQRTGNRVRNIDALPALLGRLRPDGIGTLYLLAREKVHVVFLKKGIPLSYGCGTTIPEECMHLIEGQAAQNSCCRMVWLDEQTQKWSVCRLAELVEQQIEKWDLAYPAALLAGF